MSHWPARWRCRRAGWRPCRRRCRVHRTECRRRRYRSWARRTCDGPCQWSRSASHLQRYTKYGSVILALLETLLDMWQNSNTLWVVSARIVKGVRGGGCSFKKNNLNFVHCVFKNIFCTFKVLFKQNTTGWNKLITCMNETHKCPPDTHTGNYKLTNWNRDDRSWD